MTGREPPDSRRARPGQEADPKTAPASGSSEGTVAPGAARTARCAFLHPKHLTGCRQPAEPGSVYCARHREPG
jgi:hypothetical protein